MRHGHLHRFSEVGSDCFDSAVASLLKTAKGGDPKAFYCLELVYFDFIDGDV